jgi:hypothetical protein
MRPRKNLKNCGNYQGQAVRFIGVWISAASIGQNLFHQNQNVSWLISMPRSCSRSSTFRSDNGNRMYIITARRMICGLVLK